ncbi:MAG: CBS domain-containing protein [Bacteroidia bacterium]
MFASDLISNELLPLKKTDTCETAAVFMHNFEVAHLPVIDNGKVIGYVCLKEIYAEPKSSKLDNFIRNEKQFTVFFNQHLFEVINYMSDSSLSTISVLNDEGNYSGIISYHELINDLFHHSSLAQPGGIITLEMKAKDYSLAELSRIVEFNDVKIINTYIGTTKNDEYSIFVSLKINQIELKNVIASFERHGKIIRSVNQAVQKEEKFTNRYEWLIKYLNT